MSNLVDRIQLSLNRANLSWSKSATTIGLSAQAASKWKKGQIGKETLEKLAKLTKVDYGWLATGEGEMTALPAQIQTILDNTTGPISNNAINPEQKIWLPLMNISFSCGNGVDVQCHFEETKKQLAFEPDFLPSRGVKEANVRLLYATGDSMEEFIFDGDIFAIDISDTTIRDGQIYAIYFEGEAMLKQIFKEAGGRLILHSKNPKYKDKIVTEDNGADFKVLGRQFWRAG